MRPNRDPCGALRGIESRICRSPRPNLALARLTNARQWTWGSRADKVRASLEGYKAIIDELRLQGMPLWHVNVNDYRPDNIELSFLYRPPQQREL